MKITIEIEVDDVRHPPPGATWQPHLDHADRELRSIVSWAEKHHYSWNSGSITANGNTEWSWETGRATEQQIKAMRRQVVQEALNGGPLSRGHRYAYEDRLGQDYQAILDEYAADPEAPWVKKIRSSLKASKRREEKKQAEVIAHQAEREATEAQKAALIRDLIKDEDVHQAVLEAQGAVRVSRVRIKDMVKARIMGTSEIDPTPVDATEEALWGRICRAAEVQSTFKLPTRFHMFGEKRTLTFDF